MRLMSALESSRTDPFSRLLVAVDGSPPSDAGVALATCLAASFPSTRVRFVDVGDWIRLAAECAPSFVPVGIVDVFGVARETAKRCLDDAVTSAKQSGVAADSVMREGEPIDELLAEVLAWGATCIVMGTHGREGLARAVLGSHTEGVLRRSKLPVLIGHALADASPNGIALRRVLCAIDDSAPARAAFEAAVAIARERKAQLDLLTIVAVDDTYAAAYERDGFDPAGSLPRLYAGAQEPLEAFARGAESQGIHARRHVIGASDVGYAIVAYATESKSDLIVLGTHGRHGIPRAFLGSTAESVLRHSMKPVLVLHVA